MGMAEEWDGLDIPGWWLQFIDSIEMQDTDEKIDPIVDYDPDTSFAMCRLCGEIVWGGKVSYNPQHEWQHYKENHDEVLVMVRLRCE